MSKVEVQPGPCCFCGKPISAAAPDPCRVTIETAAGKWQVWFAHAECFKARLAKDAQLDLAPAHL